MKIVYCINSVCYVGGTESVTITKANALAEISGNQVYIVVTDLPWDPVFTISEKVHLIDLKICYFKDESANRFVQYLCNKKKLKLHTLRLTQVLNEIEPDVVVSTGWSEKYILPSINYKRKPVLIRELHFPTHYRVLNSPTIVSRIMNRFLEWYDYSFKVKEYDRLIVLTEEDRLDNWNNNPMVITIPNPVRPNREHFSNYTEKTVVSMGRFSYPKNYQSLVRAWRYVANIHPEWTLKIYGPGFEDKSILQLIDSMSLSDSISLPGPTNQVFSDLSNASIFALSSRFEGFGLVLVEAMSVGLPLVSYDCPYGPKDIIEDGKNGFLIPQEDEQKLAERICWLIEHEKERKEMGQMALKMSGKYRVDLIANQWMSLFEELLEKQ